MRIGIRLLFISFLCAACGGEGSASVPTNSLDCKDQGGVWFKPALRIAGTAYCILPTTDAGAACNSVDDCESLCVAADEIGQGEQITGQCFEWSSPRGHCLNVIENNITEGTVCFD